MSDQVDSRRDVVDSGDDESTRLGGLTLVHLDQRQLDAIVHTVNGGARNVQDIYPLSPLQQGILFHRLLHEDNDTYLQSILFELQDRSHAAVLIDATQRVIHRHDALRSAVLWENLPNPLQVVYRSATLPIERLVMDPEYDSLEQLWQWMRPGSHPLDLTRAPLLRLKIVDDQHDARCYGILQVHHLVCDHQALRVLVAEIMACADGRECQLPIPLPFKDLVAQALASASSQDPETFFRRKLADIDEPTAPFGLLEVHGEPRQIDEARLTLDAKLSQRVRQQAQRYGVSAARVFHAAWALVAAHASGRDDVVYGTVISTARQRNGDAQHALGMSVNTLPLRLKLSGLSAQRLLEETHRELTELLSHEQSPLAVAQRCSGISGSAPLFTSILNYRHSLPDARAERTSSGAIRAIARADAWTHYPVALTIENLGEHFAVAAQSDRRLAAARVASYLHTAVESLLDALEHAPQTSALALPLLPDAERRQVLESFNSTQIAPAQEQLVHSLFEAQVQRTPDASAVVCAERKLTYEQLNRKADELAKVLIARGLQPDDRVAVYAERSIELVIGWLAILKAGGAYVPLDVSYPAERLAYMLTDCTPVVVLTQQRLEHRLPCSPAQIVTFEISNSDAAQTTVRNARIPQAGLRADHLAYVIYTSGSTGTPKGVMVEHRSLVNLIAWSCRAFDVGPGTRCSSLAAVGFDAASWEIWTPLSVGATLVLAPAQASADPESLLAWWAREPLDISFLATPMAEFALANDIRNPHLRTLHVGGDRLRSRPIGASFALVNNYGPTEAAVIAASGEIRADDPVIHIGRPIDNTRIYILGANGHPAAIGVTGEIFIGGVGLARGYLNRPQLTAERFAPDPFSGDPQARLYKTGDLGQWRPDGTIEYLGRNDDQVKIRGFRIELGEIETQLTRCARVKEAFAMLREDHGGEKRLVAYVVLNDENDIEASQSVEALRTHLRATLPEYMVPSAFVTLKRLPFTANGKVDRCALPEPQLDAFTTRQYEPPHGEVEQALAGIWQELLHVERVGRLDNFFALGGHSLLILQLLARLARFGLSAHARDVFHSATLAELAGMLGSKSEQSQTQLWRIPSGCTVITAQMLPLVDLEARHIERIVRAVPDGVANVQDIYPLAPLQAGILFHHLLNEQGGDAYVVPALLRVQSRRQVDELIAAVQAVVDRHDVLRTAVLWEQLPQPVQIVHRRATLPVEEIALDPECEPLEQVLEWMRPQRQRMDLRRAPLVRIQLAADARGSQWFVLLQLHHMIADATSFRQVIAEIGAHLQGRAEQLPTPLPYRDHIEQVLAYRSAGDAEAFFRGKLGTVEEPTAPFQLLDVHGDGSHISEARESWRAPFAQQLRRQARRYGVSVASLLHAAWALTLARVVGRSDVVFGTVLLGRGPASADARRSLGMFINSLPLRLNLQHISAEQLVQHTHHELAQLLEHEQAELALAQRCSSVDGSLPLFTALLNYVHGSVDLASEFTNIEGVALVATRSATNYPIVLSIGDEGETFHLEMKTSRSIDQRRMLGYMNTATASLIQALEDAPQTAALTLPVLPAHEWREVVESFNAPRAIRPQEHLIHQLFEQQAVRTPDAIAVSCEGQTLSYAQLNAAANRLAHFLAEKGVGSDQLIGLCVERSLELVVAVLGILKAGGAYLPLDPSYPADRLQHMLNDSAPRVVVTLERLRGVLPATAAEIVTLDGSREAILQRPANDVPAADRSTQQLAYVIYTSGSTGKPKGVMVEHRNVTRLFASTEQWFHFDQHSVWTLFHSIAFDFSVWELWGALLHGGRVVVVPYLTTRSPQDFYRLLCEEGVTVLNQTPSAFAQLIDAQSRNPALHHSLEFVIFGGEALEFHTLRPWIHSNGAQRPHLANMYGITETTVHVTCRLLSEHEIGSERGSLIGRSIPDLCIYLLDSCLQPVPVGVVGEIYVGGAGVARGYLNRAELTAQRFIADPFDPDARARMYKSGDLGRWRTDGTIEYLGRNDHQVKIRGFRIELGEIEAQLALYPGVRDVAVVARQDVAGDKRLVAYVAPRESTTVLDADELRSHLKSVVPEYMVPSAFVTLERLPLTANGKLDQKVLPAPDLDAYGARQYEPAQGEMEQLLADVWRDLLQVERVGRNDNFFELGGHSLSAMQVIARIESRLSTEVPIRVLFQYPTLNELATELQELRRADKFDEVVSDSELDELIEQVKSLPDSDVHALLQELRTEDRR